MTAPPPPHSAASSLHQPSLSATLSDLTSLLHLSTSALHSLPLPTTTSAAAAALLPCPFNPNHLLPPASLFSHYLNCPTSLSLPSPRYPHTLHYPSPPTSLPSTTSDLHFSLESYNGEYTPGNSFFYRDCPGPVTPTTRPPPVLTLPRVLYLECAEFDKDTEPIGFPVDFIRFLPSEIWAIRSEMDMWNGSAVGFSIRILRAILRLRDCKLSGLLDWVVASSPKYGMIIDFAMRDHVLFLVRLCLKAIVREAFGLVGLFFCNEGSKTEEMVLSPQLSNRSFECPVLGEVLMWLALQFGVLYGEMNGKRFALDLLKECILQSASDASLFPLQDNDTSLKEFDCEVKEPAGRNLLKQHGKENDSENVDSQILSGSVISISQVAAAVAALHERSLIEEKIRALRDARPLSAYQRNMEHEYLSKAAAEDRQKRPNYRPVIDHDGFFWQRSRNQDSNKTKTREELLAEERDYKRRRISYRGKKLKRNTREVMRDIIEEYMEEIRRFGGIGGVPMTVEETEASASKKFDNHENATDFSESKRNPVSEENGGIHDDRKSQSSSHYYAVSEDDIQHHRRDSAWDDELRDFNRNVKVVKYDRHDYLGRQDGRQRYSQSREPHSREKKDSIESSGGVSSQRSLRSRSKSLEENFNKRQRYEDDHNSRTRERDEHERSSYNKKRDDHKSEYRNRGKSKRNKDEWERDEEDGGHRDKQRMKTSRYKSSRPEIDNKFEDRYDPTES